MLVLNVCCLLDELLFCFDVGVVCFECWCIVCFGFGVNAYCVWLLGWVLVVIIVRMFGVGVCCLIVLFILVFGSLYLRVWLIVCVFGQFDVVCWFRLALRVDSVDCCLFGCLCWLVVVLL